MRLSVSPGRGAEAFLHTALLILWAFILMTQAGNASSHPEFTNPCPRGFYRYEDRRECMPCEKGTYGNTEGLVGGCPGICPMGTYNDLLGAKTIDDCKQCPEGFFGSAVGMKTSECSGPCPPGRFSSATGITSVLKCQVRIKYNSRFEWRTFY
jgi:hypothetical protein